MGHEVKGKNEVCWAKVKMFISRSNPPLSPFSGLRQSQLHNGDRQTNLQFLESAPHVFRQQAFLLRWKDKHVSDADYNLFGFLLPRVYSVYYCR